MTAPTIEPNTMHVLNHTGDSRFMWDPNNKTEVKVAKDQFDALRKKGYLGYKVEGDNGGKGDVIREFDPKAGKIIMAPPLAGG